MSNAILRVLVCLSLLAMGAFAAALPPPGTPPPPPPPPPPIAKPVAPPPPLHVPTPTNPVFWIECSPNAMFLPNNAPTAPVVSFMDWVPPKVRDRNGVLIQADPRLTAHVDVTRYADGFSGQFAAVVNRVLAGCTMNFLPAIDPREQYPQVVYSDPQLVNISNAIDPKTQRQIETLQFRYNYVRYMTIPANGGFCGSGGTGHATQTASCESGKICVMPQQQQNFCL